MLDKDKIDHLLRRTGFCCLPHERKAAHRAGYRATVNRLFQSALEYKLEETPPAVLAPAIVLPVTLYTFAEGILWWMRTLSRTKSPLNERLALFWHRHFATSGAKVFRPGWMFKQNQVFREHGAGSFTGLLQAMVHDPALLTWLDADDNSADHPNENFARELLELFTVGIGRYTERDVKELAKLTTGKRVTLDGRAPVRPRGEYSGPVAVLGRQGQLNLSEVAAQLAVNPNTAHRLVALLWEDFVAGPIPPTQHSRLSALWVKSRGNVAVVLREIFLSDSFQVAPRQRVVSPVEFWVACSRLLDTADFRLDDVKQLEQAGEQLFFPSSVKGWDKGLALIHPAALETRLTIAQRVVDRLPDQHFALRGIAATSNRAGFLSTITGGQVRPATLPGNLNAFTARNALILALASPDMWLI